MIISIIIPTKNNFNVLIQSLEKVTKLNLTGIEIIVVNDGDFFELPDEIKKNITLLNNSKKGVSAARNYGAGIAKGDVLFFVDDDMWINKEAINEIKQLSENNELQKNVFVINWVYPDCLINELKKEKLGRYILKSNYHTAMGRIGIKDCSGLYKKISGVGSGSFVINRQLFNDVGGYNEHIYFQGEDIELSSRLIKKEINIFISIGVCMKHNQTHRATISAYLDRLYAGYHSEFNAIRNNFIEYKYSNNKLIKNYIYTLLVNRENYILSIFNLIPNKLFFDKISFSLINILSGIQFAKNRNEYINEKNSQMGI
ncbi:MAG: glycosyltransferase family 2 protein [Bacteroidetes bacterium]|nr:glycosyltransferase family 2 protein [Bacteroidota bacterium]